MRTVSTATHCFDVSGLATPVGLVVTRATPAVALDSAPANSRRPWSSAQKRTALRSAMIAAGAAESLPAAAAVAFPENSPPQTPLPWRLSLAHSAQVLLAGATPMLTGRRPCAFGVDLEQHRHRDYQRLEAFLGWTCASRSPVHFYRRWTLAEALLKAVGGIAAAATFNALDCALESTDPRPEVRSCALEGFEYWVMWPDLIEAQTCCWLLRRQRLQ